MPKKLKTIDNQFTIPSNWYFEEDFFDKEKKEIFLKEWQLIGSRSQIKNPGQVLVAEVANNPIIITCQKDNTLKAFYNVCQHRGGPLAYENCSVNKLQCKYHGWVYDLDGKLVGINTQLTNKIVLEAFLQKKIEEFCKYNNIKSEVKFSDNTRFDFLNSYNI